MADGAIPLQVGIDRRHQLGKGILAYRSSIEPLGGSVQRSDQPASSAMVLVLMVGLDVD